jgi:acylphosphatase
VLSGDDEQVESMISALWDGPPAARVAAVDRFEHNEPVTPGFAVRSTA